MLNTASVSIEELQESRLPAVIVCCIQWLLYVSDCMDVVTKSSRYSEPFTAPPVKILTGLLCGSIRQRPARNCALSESRGCGSVCEERRVFIPLVCVEEWFITASVWICSHGQLLCLFTAKNGIAAFLPTSCVASFKGFTALQVKFKPPQTRLELKRN